MDSECLALPRVLLVVAATVALIALYAGVAATLPLPDYTTALCNVARGIDLNVYRKTVRGPKKPKQKNKHQKRVLT